MPINQVVKSKPAILSAERSVEREIAEQEVRIELAELARRVEDRCYQGIRVI